MLRLDVSCESLLTPFIYHWTMRDLEILQKTNLTVQPDSDTKSHDEGGRSENLLATSYRPAVRPQLGTGLGSPRERSCP